MNSFFKSLDLFTNKSQKIKIFLLFIGGFFSMAFEMIGLGLIGIYILAISDTSKFLDQIPFDWVADYLNGLQRFELFFILSSILILAFILKSIYSLFYAYFETNTQKSIILSNSSKLYHIYLNKPYSYFLKQNPQKLVNNINHVLKLGITYIFYHLLLFREVILIIFLVLGSLYISWKISISIFLILSLLTFLIFFLIKKELSKLGDQIVYSGQIILKDLNEGIRGIKLSKLLKNYNFLSKKLATGLEIREKSQLKHAVYQRIPRAAIETFAVIIVVFISMILIFRFDDPNKIFPILAVLSIILVRMVPSFTNINFALSNLKYSSSAYNTVFKDLSNINNHETINSEGKQNLNENFILKNNTKIQLDNISFTYDDVSKRSLSDISIEFHTNSSIGFVGKSGSGKTTLVDIIIGLLKPTNGQIKIDNHNVSIFDSQSWQKQIGYVPQDIILNNSTIKENIAYGIEIEKINKKKVLDVISKTQLDDLIKNLPLGIDTVLTDLGKNLSGGEKQRIGIARALYNDPRILILDEATSSLDEINEENILNNLKLMKKNITIIIIAHKHSTIKYCDKVFLLKSGKYIGSGKPENLLKNLEGFTENAES